MGRIFQFTLLALTLIVLTQGTIMAQGIPQGSYQQTCNNVAVNGNVLTANCRDGHGNWISAQLPDIQRCNSDIVNDNGALRCTSAGYGTPGAYPAGNGPNGSYMQSCQDIHVGGDDLHARCQTRDGNWHETKLDDYNKCHGDILNDNGNLKCVSGVSYGAPPYQGGYPAGTVGAPYSQTCKDIKSHGDDLEARCKTSDGNWNNTKLDDYRKCKGQIINDDGNLRCVAGVAVGGPGGYPNVNGPSGSYVQSCTEIHASGDDLHARCQTGDGGWHNTKLDDYQKCQGDISNDNGNLRCDKDSAH
ncbi:MAG TPA: CVNH domain-containing protein [Candidatus Angelobacter sp.]|jgi:hypothetical protein